MAWINVTVDIDGVTYLGHRQGIIFSIPFSSGLEVGNSFKADGAEHEVINISDLHGRGEVFVMDTKEVKYDKPKTRRASDRTGEQQVERQSDDGWHSKD